MRTLEPDDTRNTRPLLEPIPEDLRWTSSRELANILGIWQGIKSFSEATVEDLAAYAEFLYISPIIPFLESELIHAFFVQQSLTGSVVCQDDMAVLGASNVVFEVGQSICVAQVTNLAGTARYLPKIEAAVYVYSSGDARYLEALNRLKPGIYKPVAEKFSVWHTQKSQKLR